MNNRKEAESKFYWGNKMIAMQDISNILKAISFYTKALFYLRSISQSELTEEDNKSIKDILDALLRGLNKLLCMSSDWSQVVDELEKFLIFYIDSVRVLNKTHQRLPGLDALELIMNGPFTALSAKAPSAPQKERLKTYLAIISLFHEGMETVKNHTLSSDDPVVKKAFDLYQQALLTLEKTMKVELSVEERPVPTVVAPIPPKLTQPAGAEAKQSLRAPSPLSQMSSAPQSKVTRLRVFDYVEPDEPKRVYIRKLMEKKDFTSALAGFRRIMNCIADDYRCACNCQLIIGEDNSIHGRFVEAIECYMEAFNCCNHIQEVDVVEDDSVNISKVLNAFVMTINQITKNWATNLVLASTCVADFLNYYVDNFEALNSGNKKLLGLDGVSLDCFVAFLEKGSDEVSREKTRVYLTVIGMFRKNPLLEEGGLASMIDEVVIKQDMWSSDATMKATFELFDKALALVKRIKGHDVLNPELKAVSESLQKRQKVHNESSSSSSAPRLV